MNKFKKFKNQIEKEFNELNIFMQNDNFQEPLYSKNTMRRTALKLITDELKSFEEFEDWKKQWIFFTN